MGEVIRYLTPFWGWSRDPVNATILKIDDEDEIPLKLDTRDVLERTHKVTRVKKYVNGVLEECPGEESMKIGEFQLENGHVKDFHKRKSLEAQRLQSIQQEYIENWEKTAKQFGLPEDLCYNTTFDGKVKQKKKSEICSTKQSPKGEKEHTTETGDSEQECDDCTEDTKTTVGSVNTEQINFKRMLEKYSNNRETLEKEAAAGQKKQAVQVNKNRKWIGGEHITDGTICTLRLGRDRNKVGIKDLPVLVWKQVHYKKTGTIRYHLLSKVGYLEKTYGREELEPQPHLNAELMGIDSNAHDAKITITPLQAQEMYLKIGGHRSFCRCVGNCSNSKTCKCKKMKKTCTSRCHGKKTNLVCGLCIVQE